MLVILGIEFLWPHWENYT